MNGFVSCVTAVFVGCGRKAMCNQFLSSVSACSAGRVWLYVTVCQYVLYLYLRP